jgi:EAL domain-containing protein (putative c-di-GMP-specific phosphodiesterase class I)
METTAKQRFFERGRALLWQLANNEVEVEWDIVELHKQTFAHAIDGSQSLKGRNAVGSSEFKNLFPGKTLRLQIEEIKIELDLYREQLTLSLAQPSPAINVKVKGIGNVKNVSAQKNFYRTTVFSPILPGSYQFFVWSDGDIPRKPTFFVEVKSASPEMLNYTDDLCMHYMPIVNLYTAQIAGYEALARSKQSGGFPALLFKEAHAISDECEIELDMHCINLALTDMASKKYPLPRRLSVNAHATTYISEKFRQDIFEAAKVPYPWLTTFELLEGNVDELIAVQARKLECSNRGFFFATDDQGAPGTDHQRTIFFNPHWVKFDRSVVSEAYKNATQEGYMKLYSDMARKNNATAIAEGIESDWGADKVAQLMQQGITYGQGYLFGQAQPLSKIQKTLAPTALTILNEARKRVEGLH